MSSSLYRCRKRLGEIPGVFFLGKNGGYDYVKNDTEWSTAVNV